MRKILIIVFLSCTLLSVAKASSTPEQVKALLVFNFIRLMEWEDKSGTINIAFVGQDQALFDAFKEMTEQRTIGGKKVTIQKINNLSEVSSFHLIYLSESGSNELTQTKNFSNTVIVSEKEGMAKKGSFINFITVDGKLRFEINKTKFESSKVKVSNQLLSLAILV